MARLGAGVAPCIHDSQGQFLSVFAIDQPAETPTNGNLLDLGRRLSPYLLRQCLFQGHLDEITKFDMTVFHFYLLHP